MKFENLTALIFRAIPEFKEALKEDSDENYYNFFLGNFGIFTRDAIRKNEEHAVRCLVLINDLINDNINDWDFRNKIVVNILEILSPPPAGRRLFRSGR